MSEVPLYMVAIGVGGNSSSFEPRGINLKVFTTFTSFGHVFFERFWDLKAKARIESGSDCLILYGKKNQSENFLAMKFTSQHDLY